MRITRLLAAASVAAVFAALTGSPAWAHNSLTDASPAKNATLKKAPGGVKLTFLQRVDPDALEIAVADSAKREVAASGPTASGKSGTLTFDDTLANGTYTVTYRVVSLDGHPVRGSYKFTVADASAPTPASPAARTPAPTTAPAAAAPATVPASAEASGPGWLGWAAGVGVILLVAAGVFVLFRRRVWPFDRET
jgi:methionine-rich copper-binding protein CopC